MRVRAIQWATGAMGTACLRSMLDHPDVEVVGTYVYSAAKAGRDIGEMAGRAPIGVLSTDDVEEICSLDADVVVHAGRIGRYGSHDAELIRLLESGKNVISINGYSDPAAGDSERYAALQAACERGGTTLMGAGLNPGFAAEQLAVVVSGLINRLDHLEVVEHADSRAIRDPAYLFDTLGFGADLAERDLTDPENGPAGGLDGMYTETLGCLADRLGMTLDRIEPDHVFHTAAADIELRAGVVRAGTVSHINWRWHAWTRTGDTQARRLTMSIHWYVEDAHLADPNPPLWLVHVTGHPGVTVHVELEKHPDDTTRMPAEPYAVGAQVVNTFDHVVAAPAGVALRPVSTPVQQEA
jgi:2,4-diaminopentanoate dehydrogenase